MVRRINVLFKDNKMKYKLWLPTKDGKTSEVELNNNSFIIIGANGSGKSKLGAWIEEIDKDKVHRIGGQRSLVFKEYIEQKSYEQSSRQLMYGSDDPKLSVNKEQRWNWDGKQYNRTTCMLNDAPYVFSAFLAKDTLQRHNYIKECKQFEEQGRPHKPVPEMEIDKLIRIWRSIFPHRNIQVEDAKITAELANNKYPAKEMSDGERVVLYLIAQALAVPEGKVVIIDEPELHLHRSIMTRLWYEIEKERRDCLFVYITHDTQFAAQHIGAKKLWIKSYDGHQWDWEFIKESELPEQLLLDILGNRKPVIFVEGKSNSPDYKLYRLIFKDFYVIPCESCKFVITRTKAMRKLAELHRLECYGIIDRDYRSEHEIEKLKNDNIYALKVAEVENLFLVPEVLEIIGKIEKNNDEEASKIVEEVKNYIINDRFKKEMDTQISAAFITQVRYKLSIANIKEDDIKKEVIEEKLHEIINNCRNLIDEKTQSFKKVCDDNDYKEILKIFNRKDLGDSVRNFFGIKDKKLQNYILSHSTSGNYANRLIEAISLYTPKEDIMKAHQDALDSARKSEGVSVNDSEA